jgi:hypothetical protein
VACKLPWDEHSSLFGNPLLFSGIVFENKFKKNLGLAPQLGLLKNALAYFVSTLAAKKKDL